MIDPNRILSTPGLLRLLVSTLLLTVFSACVESPEARQPSTSFDISAAIRCASPGDDPVRHAGSEIIAMKDSIIDEAETTGKGDNRLPVVIPWYDYYLDSPLGQYIDGEEVTCVTCTAGTEDSLRGAAWFFADSLIGLKLSFRQEGPGAWEPPDSFVPIDASDLRRATSGIWEALSIWEPVIRENDVRLFRVNTDPAWIAVVRREKYGAWESLDIRLLRDVSLIDYLDNRQQSMLDTLVVDVYRDRGATVFARVDRSRCLGGHYWIERDAHQTEEPLRGIVYWAIPPQILDPSVSYGFSDSLCDDIPLVRVIGIAGDSVIGSGLSHSPSGIPFYLLAAEVLVGSSGR